MDLYKELFYDICEEEVPDHSTRYDRWGAIEVCDESGRAIFSGDGSGELPWYECESDLRKRLQQHQIEMAKE